MRKIAFVFPGQGAQYVGMGQEFYTEFELANGVFREADQRLGFSLSELCFNGPEEQLRLTVNTQPAILTVSCAILKVFENEGFKADYVAGHSLGEYSALVAAGSLSFSDAVWLVQQRGSFMQEAVPSGKGKMAAILGVDIEQIKALCLEASDAGTVEPANYNSPGQIVIAGTAEAIDKAIELAKKYGAKKAMGLAVSGPFHSSLLKPASTRLAEALGKIQVKDAVIPMIANISADITTDAGKIRANLIEQVANAVKWQQSIERLSSLGVNTYIEIGPGKVLSGLIKKIDKSAEVYNIEDKASLLQTISALRGGLDHV